MKKKLFSIAFGVVFMLGAMLAFSSTSRAAFDAEYYAKNNPDVVAKVGTSAKALEQHYKTFGVKEGRAGDANEATVIKAAFTKWGSKTGLAAIFDPVYYAKLYPQVAAQLKGNPAALYNHFLKVGLGQGAMPNAFVDAEAYAAMYKDTAAVAENVVALVAHFATVGVTENRVASPEAAEIYKETGKVPDKQAEIAAIATTRKVTVTEVTKEMAAVNAVSAQDAQAVGVDISTVKKASETTAADVATAVNKASGTTVIEVPAETKTEPTTEETQPQQEEEEPKAEEKAEEPAKTVKQIVDEAKAAADAAKKNAEAAHKTSEEVKSASSQVLKAAQALTKDSSEEEVKKVQDEINKVAAEAKAALENAKNALAQAEAADDQVNDAFLTAFYDFSVLSANHTSDLRYADKLQAELDGLLQRQKDVQDYKATDEANLKAAKEELAAAEAAVAAAEKAFNDAYKELSDAVDKANTAYYELCGVIKDDATFKKLDDAKTASDNARTAAITAQNEMRQAHQKAGEIGKEQGAINGDIGRLEGDNSRAKEEKQHALDDAKQLTADIEQNDQTIKELNQKIEDSMEELAKAEKKEDIRNLESEIVYASAQIYEKESENVDLKADLEASNQNAKNQDAIIAENEKTIASRKEDLEKVTKQLEEAEKAALDKEAIVTEKWKANGEADKAYKDAIIEAGKESAEVNTKATALSDAEAVVSSADNATKDKETKLINAEADRDRIFDDVQMKQTWFDDRAAELESIQEEIDQVKAELEKAQNAEKASDAKFEEGFDVLGEASEAYTNSSIAIDEAADAIRLAEEAEKDVNAAQEAVDNPEGKNVQ